MKRALELARRGRGRVEPNPMVGAVLVREGSLVSEGYHRDYGGPHAEVAALRKAGGSARGAELYVTLEPCSTTGKTPPCTDAILRSGVRTVRIGARDPNPANRSGGVRELRLAGVEVVEGLLRREATELVDPFRRMLVSREPFVTAKWAMTLDGQVATRSGRSKWISSVESRRVVHRERARSDGILVGSGTVLADDPELTTRLVRGPSPVRLVADSRLRIPLGSKLVRSARDVPVWILTTGAASRARERELVRAGCDVIRIRGSEGKRVSVRSALREVRRRGLGRILLEGGPSLTGAAFGARSVHRTLVFVSSRLFGGGDGRLPIAGRGCAIPSRGPKSECIRRRRLGSQDVLIESMLGA